MISVCTVIKDGIDEYLQFYLDSLEKKTELVKEVLLAKADAEPGVIEEWEKNGIRFIKFGCKGELSKLLSPNDQHAFGMHECLAKAEQEYIMFCDPDVFFYTNVDVFYLDILKKYNLDYIGVSHHSAHNLCYTFFPCIINSLVKKSSLPDENFLKGKLKLKVGDGPTHDIDGKFLTFGSKAGYKELFPNPEGIFDTGSYLWLWANQQKWKWLSFQTTDCRTYTTSYCRGNVKIKEKFKKKKLLYHVVSAVCKPWEYIELAREAYQNSIE